MSRTFDYNVKLDELFFAAYSEGPARRAKKSVFKNVVEYSIESNFLNKVYLNE